MRMSVCALVTMHGRSSEGSSRRSDPVGPLTWRDYSADSRCLDAPPHGGYSWRTGGGPREVSAVSDGQPGGRALLRGVRCPDGAVLSCLWEPDQRRQEILRTLRRGPHPESLRYL